MLYRSLIAIALLASFALLPIAAVAGDDITMYDSVGNVLEPSQINRLNIRKTCGDCHDVDAQAKSLHFNVGDPKPDPEAADCLSCHLPKANVFTPTGTIRATVATPDSENCVTCHSDVRELLAKSVHGHADKKPGDHPTCVSCHSGNPHAVKSTAKTSRREKAELCASCHRKPELMARYGVDPDAVSSYEVSFHGKSLLRFGKGNSAGCTDCHGSHEVLAPTTSTAPTNGNRVASTCGKCHTGAKMNFSRSGANHLKLKMEESIVLRIEELLFKTLTYGTMAFLMGMIALDLRKKAFCQECRPRAGRLVAGIIALSFTSLAAGLVMGLLHIPGAQWTWVASVIFLVVALAVFRFRTAPKLKPEKERVYERFTLNLRVQHICLAISFTILVLTGMPLRFANVGWSHYLQLLFGGFEGARIAHRAAAILMTGTWIWHFFFLIYRWKSAGFSLRSWTMIPTRKDVSDFFGFIKYGLGLTSVRPLYDRFQFREKFDYLAVYWGMPVMVFSGAVLWWPVFWGNRLTDLGFGIAYIAHSDEALLAMLAILVWHMYNTHLDPEHFPMSKVWYSGALTESEMELEHPMEKAKLDGEAPSPHSSPARGEGE